MFLHGTLGSVKMINSGGNTSGMPPTLVLTIFNLEINSHKIVGNHQSLLVLKVKKNIPTRSSFDNSHTVCFS